jgi:D-alanine-D-alanine ligase
MIRPAAPGDREQLLEMTRQTGVFTVEEIGWATELVFGLVVPPPGREYQLHVLVEKGQLAGYVCFGPAGRDSEVYDLYWLVVAPDVQQRGMGSRLLGFVEDDVRRSGGRTLLIETSAGNGGARRFYEAKGYREVSHLKDFMRRRPDRVVYARNLG